MDDEVERLKAQVESLRAQMRGMIAEFDQARRKLGLAPLVDDQIQAINMRMGRHGN